MNDPCSILCWYHIFQEGGFPICTNHDNGTLRVRPTNCEYFQLRDGYHEMLEALENRIDTISFQIDADLVEESNRMWRRRFITAACVGTMLAAFIYAIIDIWVMV